MTRFPQWRTSRTTVPRCWPRPRRTGAGCSRWHTPRPPRRNQWDERGFRRRNGFTYVRFSTSATEFRVQTLRTRQRLHTPACVAPGPGSLSSLSGTQTAGSERAPSTNNTVLLSPTILKGRGHAQKEKNPICDSAPWVGSPRPCRRPEPEGRLLFPISVR